MKFFGGKICKLLVMIKTISDDVLLFFIE